MRRTSIATLLVLVALSAFSARAADPNATRNLASVCANCHGTNGHSTGVMPSLAGLESSYMAQQLIEFKTGKRPATIMHQLSKGLTDEQIGELASYFAAQSKCVTR